MQMKSGLDYVNFVVYSYSTRCLRRNFCILVSKEGYLTEYNLKVLHMFFICVWVVSGTRHTMDVVGLKWLPEGGGARIFLYS